MSLEQNVRLVTSAAIVALSVNVQTAPRSAPLSFLTTVGLTADEIAAVDAGRPVAKVLAWGAPSEVYVFGAVHVDGTPETYLKAARDVGRLNGAPGYMGIGELSEQATLADLAALAFEADDVKALKNCREGA